MLTRKIKESKAAPRQLYNSTYLGQGCQPCMCSATVARTRFIDSTSLDDGQTFDASEKTRCSRDGIPVVSKRTTASRDPCRCFRTLLPFVMSNKSTLYGRYTPATLRTPPAVSYSVYRKVLLPHRDLTEAHCAISSHLVSSHVIFEIWILPSLYIQQYSRKCMMISHR